MCSQNTGKLRRGIPGQALACPRGGTKSIVSSTFVLIEEKNVSEQ